MNKLRSFLTIFLIVVFCLGAMAAVPIDSRYPWFTSWIADSLFPPRVAKVNGPVHVMFLFVDHFEPHDQATMDRWFAEYPALAARHKDADGRMPQRSFFWYFAASKDPEKKVFLRQLSQMAFDGVGEVELHMHHFGDNEKSLTKLITHAVDLSQETGAFITAEEKPRTTYGFIHGMWALDNSRPGMCGVNNEIELLKRLDCYADFTHPSWGKMHPRMINRLYYVTDDPEKPKSYDFGAQMRVGGREEGDLLLFTGQSVVRWKGLLPEYDHGEVSAEEPPTPERIADWIKKGVHVKGRPEWVFVKVFSHGTVAEDHDAVLGGLADTMYTELEKYNDGSKYVLHYVTAREAYNIAKAAEAGRSGNPNAYRDFLIPSYVNRYFTASVPFETLSVTPQRMVVRFLAEPGTRVQVRLRGSGVGVAGAEMVDFQPAPGQVRVVDIDVLGDGTTEFTVTP